MTFVFDRGPWKGKAITDDAIRTGELERFLGRLNVDQHPDVAQAVQDELDRRSLAARAAVLKKDTETALNSMRAPIQPVHPMMPMPCGHPVSDMDWVDEKHEASYCRGCTEEDACAMLIFEAQLGGGNLGYENIRQYVRQHSAALRQRLT